MPAACISTEQHSRAIKSNDYVRHITRPPISRLNDYPDDDRSLTDWLTCRTASAHAGTWHDPRRCWGCSACTCYLLRRARHPRIPEPGARSVCRCWLVTPTRGPSRSPTLGSCRLRSRSSPGCACCAGFPEWRSAKPRLRDLDSTRYMSSSSTSSSNNWL